jgi:hypothetical protein
MRADWLGTIPPETPPKDGSFEAWTPFDGKELWVIAALGVAVLSICDCIM